MSFPRYQEIYPSDGNAGIAAGVPAHRLDEFPVGYSSASCTPALLASASPTGSDYAVMSSYWSTVFQRPATSVLTGCLTPGGKRSLFQESSGENVSVTKAVADVFVLLECSD